MSVLAIDIGTHTVRAAVFDLQIGLHHIATGQLKLDLEGNVNGAGNALKWAFDQWLEDCQQKIRG